MSEAVWSSLSAWGVKRRRMKRSQTKDHPETVRLGNEDPEAAAGGRTLTSVSIFFTSGCLGLISNVFFWLA